MGAVSFFAVFFLSLGPVIAVYTTLVNKKAVNSVLSILSAFIWVIGLVLCAATWMILSPIKDVFWFICLYGTMWQEGVRYLLYQMLCLYQRSLAKVGESAEINVNTYLACGVGIAFGYTSVFVIQALVESASSASLFSDKCEHMNIFFSTALHSLCFGVLNCVWTVMMFVALQNKTRRFVAVVVVSHFLASLMTTAGDCAVSLPLLIVLSFGLLVLLFWQLRHYRVGRFALTL
eukprot:c2622_g1_i1.p1 GENE.c2622_g1_i1~~c2622_g1_i1.p1  ORF type:complete len:233 (+),score=31.81 c2622_g1_i1:19-717(+)